MNTDVAIPEVQPAWPPDVERRYREAGLWAGTLLGDHVLDGAVRHPGRTALVCGHRRWTHAELADEVGSVASGLRTLFAAGDRVVVHLPNRWEQVVTTLACLRSGVIPLWSLPQHGEHELVGFARHIGARGIVTTDRYRGADTLAVACRVRAEVPDLEHVIVVAGADPGGGVPAGTARGTVSDPALPDGIVPFASLRGLAPARDTPGSEPGDVALLIPSGGTTGASKIVPRTHDDLVCLLREAVRACDVDHRTRYLAVLPLGHGFSNTGPGVLGTLAVGGTVVISPSPDPHTALDLLEREQVTMTSVVPAIVLRWLEHLAARASGGGPDRRPGRRPVLLQVGAARLDPAAGREIERLLPAVVQQVYGMSEGLMCATAPGDPPDVRLTTQGRPISPADEVRVVATDGQDAEPGATGELWTRGPYTVRRYHRSPAADAAAFTPDGWYRTGDLVRRTPEGRVVVVGRLKDVINRGGEKISVEEVEDVIRTHDAVLRCAVVGMPDERLGEAVCAYVVPRPGTDPALLGDIGRHLTARGLAPYKVPKMIIAVDRLPLTGIGKVDRKRLRGWLA